MTRREGERRKREGRRRRRRGAYMNKYLLRSFSSGDGGGRTKEGESASLSHKERNI